MTYCAFGREEGEERREGENFISPSLVCFFGAFFPQREESGVPRIIERTIQRPGKTAVLPEISIT